MTLTVTLRATWPLLLLIGCTEPDADGAVLLIFVVLGVGWLWVDAYRWWRR